ncbi:MAG: hypothetical protein JWM95_560 [Gemmatimonadetes bacterium]|nr:hypothetical protein [Gemmatimonadota bacterium]
MGESKQSASTEASKSHRVKAFGPSTSGSLWCLHCERTYDEMSYAESDDLLDGEPMQMCPYADCNGDAVVDAWDWSKLRELHPEYPEKPVPNTHYPLYSKR